MSPVRFVYEKGIEAYLGNDGNWYCQSATGPSLLSLVPFEPMDGLRPMLVTDRRVKDRDRTFLLLPGNELFGILLGQMTWSPKLPSTYVGKLLNLNYIIGAVGYHCRRLAEVISEVRNDFVGLPFPIETSSPVNFGNGGEAYYEFDAFITAARRVYETLRYPLWKAYGVGSSCPRSFQETLPRLVGLPTPLAARLQASWSDVGEKVTAYRDCIQHNSPIDYGIGDIQMVTMGNGIWAAVMLIPDNPEVKSKFKFTYTQKLDGLTFAWQVTHHLVELARSVMAELPTEPTSDNESKASGAGAEA